MTLYMEQWLRLLGGIILMGVNLVQSAFTNF